MYILRAELELRDRLNQRDQRISQLKDALASKSRACDQAKRQLEAVQGRLRGNQDSNSQPIKTISSLQTLPPGTPDTDVKSASKARNSSSG